MKMEWIDRFVYLHSANKSAIIDNRLSKLAPNEKIGASISGIRSGDAGKL